MTMPTTPAALLAELSQRAANLMAEQVALTTQARSLWVVLSASKIPLSFDIDAAGGVTNPRTTTVGNATRLSKANAVHIASQTRDGRDEFATAYPLDKAYEIAINELGCLMIALKQAA